MTWLRSTLTRPRIITCRQRALPLSSYAFVLATTVPCAGQSSRAPAVEGKPGAGYQAHRVAGHAGDHLAGFTANFSRFTDDKLAVIVLTNLMPLDIGGITRRVAGFYVPALLPAKTGEP
jgi:hypothetical protein